VRVVIVAMGRGGPAEPVVTRGDLETIDARALLVRADRGEHAATDAYEDAIVARVATVGARRAGAGLAGATLHDTVARAVAVADGLEPDLIILEGSGTAIPPARANATILVAGGRTPAESLRDGLAPFRLLISDLIVVTMSFEPVLPTETISALSSQLAEFARDVPIARTVLRPLPLQSVAGRKVFFVTTAPSETGPSLQEHLERVHGAVVVGRSHRLADRPGLANDLAGAEGTYEVLLTEVKAAAIDVAARAALAAGAEVVFADNAPDDLSAEFDTVLKRAMSA
jgi:cyclic 2,3-diphosphoglycerate synthetase